MAHSAPEIIYGVAGVGSMSPEKFTDIFSVLEKHHVNIVDSAISYPDSEATLGKHNVPSKFTVHTKAPALKPGSMSKQGILDGMAKSLKELGAESVELYYLHAPDPTTPIEETLSAIQELYAAGKFKRFGLSNFLPQDVQKIHDIQSAAKSVLPTVFQGNYNPVARHAEVDLFPLLRKLRIGFYAYSPIAGGFLVKDSAQLRAKEAGGRFAGDSYLADMYYSLYGKESMYRALDEWGAIARDAGVSKAALAYRWVTYHSALQKEHGDAIIVGASSVAQLEETLTAIEAGPLDGKTATRASDVWETVNHEAPRDNYQDYIRSNAP